MNGRNVNNVLRREKSALLNDTIPENNCKILMERNIKKLKQVSKCIN